MKKLTPHGTFGMFFAIPLFVSIAFVSVILSFIVYILAILNKLTGTSIAFDWLLFRSKEYSKRMKFRSLLSKMDKNTMQ